MGDIDNDFMNFAKPEKNTGSHESDDFEQVEEAEDDDFCITSANNDFAHNLNSTDRPLVTLDEISPSAPPAPPSLSTVPESMKFDDDDDDEPEYERQYSQPPAPKKDNRKKSFEPEVEATAPDLSPFDTLKGADFSSLDNLDPYVAVCPPKPPTPEVEELVRESPEAEKTEVGDGEVEDRDVSSTSKCSCPFSAWFNPQNLDPRDRGK